MSEDTSKFDNLPWQQKRTWEQKSEQTETETEVTEEPQEPIEVTPETPKFFQGEPNETAEVHQLTPEEMPLHSHESEDSDAGQDDTEDEPDQS